MKIVCCVPPHAACDFLFLDSAEHSSLCTAGSSSRPLIRYSHQPPPPQRKRRTKRCIEFVSLLRLLSSENEVKSFTFFFFKTRKVFLRTLDSKAAAKANVAHGPPRRYWKSKKNLLDKRWLIVRGRKWRESLHLSLLGAICICCDVSVVEMRLSGGRSSVESSVYMLRE